MAMQGNLHDMAVADLIQHNCQEQKTARLVIKHSGQQATLFFSDGKIKHATLGNSTGEEVVYEVLTWQDGQFTLDIGLTPPEITFKRSWSGLLLEGARRLDETQHKLTNNSEKGDTNMAGINSTLEGIMGIDGVMAAAIVDWTSGMTLGTVGKGVDIDLAAAGNTNVVRAKIAVMKDLKIKGLIEDILITLTDQYHMIRLLSSNSNLFIYVVMNRSQANLGLARHKLAALEKELTI